MPRALLMTSVAADHQGVEEKPDDRKEDDHHAEEGNRAPRKELPFLPGRRGHAAPKEHRPRGRKPRRASKVFFVSAQRRPALEARLRIGEDAAACAAVEGVTPERLDREGPRAERDVRRRALTR